MEAPEEALVWKALSDPTRRAILDLLAAGARTTGALEDLVPCSRFSVMKHLGVLAAAGLVRVERRGRLRWNCLEQDPLRRAWRWLEPLVARPAVSSPWPRSAARPTAVAAARPPSLVMDED